MGAEVEATCTSSSMPEIVTPSQPKATLIGSFAEASRSSAALLVAAGRSVAEQRVGSSCVGKGGREGHPWESGGDGRPVSGAGRAGGGRGGGRRAAAAGVGAYLGV